MGKIIAVSNQKGGVGKTTTVINLGHELAKMGQKVLLIDGDPQANCSSGLGFSPAKTANASLYELLIEEKPLSNVLYPTNYENLSIIPSSNELSGLQVEIASMPKREFILQRALKPLAKNFDFLLIDTPPSLGLLTINAFCAAASVLIPIQCEYYALEGISQLLKTMRLVKSKLHPSLYLEGIILTMYDTRTKLAKEVAQSVLRNFKNKTFATIIPRNVKLSEAPSHAQPVGVYDSLGFGAKSYHQLALEFLKRSALANSSSSAKPKAKTLRTEQSL